MFWIALSAGNYRWLRFIINKTFNRMRWSKIWKRRWLKHSRSLTLLMSKKLSHVKDPAEAEGGAELVEEQKHIQGLNNGNPPQSLNNICTRTHNIVETFSRKMMAVTGKLRKKPHWTLQCSWMSLCIPALMTIYNASYRLARPSY